MKILFTEDAWEDYLYWQQHDKKILKKVNNLIKDITREAFTGTGKPEALRFSLSGYWSRRITQEHRIVYRVEGDTLFIAQCRHHYEDE